MVDYSRFDNIGIDDSDDESDDEQPPAQPLSSSCTPTTRVHEKPSPMKRGSSMSPRFVKLHPNDSGAGLKRVFLEEDPRSFQPMLHEASGTATMWGLGDEDLGFAMMTRKMETQFLYNRGEYNMTPEQQFVEVLVERKREKIAARRDTVSQGCDLVVRIALAEFWRRNSFNELRPSVWRRIRVSGAMNLQMLHDRVLGPAMGWARNYHAFFFTDFTDGAVWCPIGESSAIDMMHASNHVIAALRPSETTLGELLRTPGDRIGYTYDLGDFFEHVITLEKLVPVEASTGAIRVLDGAMRCPNEDGNGNDRYQEEVLDLFVECGRVGDLPLRFPIGQRVQCNMGPEEKREDDFTARFMQPRPVYKPGTIVASPYTEHGEVYPYQVRVDERGLLIYCTSDDDWCVKVLGTAPKEPAALASRRAFHDACMSRSGAMNVPSGVFDPAEFDLEACRARVFEAIGSRASAQEGSKVFNWSPYNRDAGCSGFFNPTSPGRAPKERVRGGGVLTEAVSTRPDKPEERVCAACGKPKPRKSCAHCKTIFYCSRDCQVANWKAHKLICKKLAAERAAYKRDKKSAQQK